MELILSPATELVITDCQKTHVSLHVKIQLRNGSMLLHRIKENDTKMIIAWICSQLRRHLLFHLFNVLQILKDCRMFTIEFFGDFLRGYKRISFEDRSQLVFGNFQWWPRHSSSSL